MGVGPVLVLVCGDEAGCAHLHGVLLLGGSAADGDNLAAAECFGTHDTEMAQTTDTDDTDTLSWTGTVLGQWREGGHTTAEHRCGQVGWDSVRDIDDPATHSTPVGGVSTARLGAVDWPWAVECVDDGLAVLLVAGLRLAGAQRNNVKEY